MNNHVKNQHYVPQFLLKNFASREKKFIWTYDKNENYSTHNQIKERAIRGVASEDFFYDQLKNSKIGSYEYILQQVEDAAAPIIAKLIDTKNITSLSEEERRMLSIFIIFQNLRTKGELVETEFSLNNLFNLITDKANIKIPSIDSKQIWFKILKEATVFYKILTNKVWMLCESNNAFLISDNPVTLQNSTNTSDIIGTLGLDCFGIEIYLPISPSLTLCLFCEKTFAENGYHNNCLPNLTCDSENVKNLNSLQIAYSHRFIFSHKNEFSLVKNRLKNI